MRSWLRDAVRVDTPSGTLLTGYDSMDDVCESLSRSARSAASFLESALLSCVVFVAALSVTVGPIVIDFALEITWRERRSPSVWLWALVAIGWVLACWYLLAWPSITSLSRHDKRLGLRDATAIAVLVMHAIVIVLYSLMLDCGEHLRACLYGEAGYAAGAILIVARRARSLTSGDLLFLRWGGQAIIAITVPIAVEVWRAKELI